MYTMSRLKRITFSLTPFIYIIAIAILVVKYFATIATIQETVSFMQIEVQKVAANRFMNEYYKAITIKSDGSTYSFNYFHAPVLNTGDGAKHRLSMLSYETDSNSITLTFTYNVKLKFISEEGSLTLESYIPAVRFGVKNLIIPWQVNKPFTLRTNEDGGLELASNNDENAIYRLTYDDKTITVDSKKNRLILGAFPSTSLNFSQNSFGNIDLLDNFLALQNENYTNNFDLFLDNLKDKALKSITERLNTTDGTYRLYDGSYAFDEQTALLQAILLAKPGNDDWGNFLTLVQKHRNALSLNSAAYFGDIVNLADNYAEKINQERVEQVRDAIGNHDASIFLQDNLFNLVVINREYELRTSLGILASEVNTEESTLITAGKLLYLLDCLDDELRSIELQGARLQITELINRISFFSKGLLIYHNDIIEFKASFRAGYALIRATNNRILNRPNKEREAFIGEKLIETVSTFINNRGFLAESATWSGKIAKYSEQQFTYADVMTYLWPEAFIPKIVSAHDYLPISSYVYSALPSYEIVQRNSRVYLLNFSAAPQVSHYIAIRGFNNVTGINLNNQNDLELSPNLNNISQGYYYDRNSSMLYIKLQPTTRATTLYIVLQNTAVASSTVVNARPVSLPTTTPAPRIISTPTPVPVPQPVVVVEEPKPVPQPVTTDKKKRKTKK